MRLIDADALEPDADYDDGEYWAVSIVQIHNASTIEPERKTGRWIVGANHGLNVHTLTCDRCNHSEVSSSFPNFCSDCGAYMRGEQE